VDDDPYVLSSVLSLLQAEGYRARGFSSPEEFLLHCDVEEAECVVLGICMPAMSGLELQQKLALAGRAPPAVFLTGPGDIAAVVRAIRAGAVDVLARPPDAHDLLRAIAEALKIDEHQRVARKETALFMQRLASLTARELQVFRCIVDGRMNKQTAAELGISEATVKVHRCRVMQKLRARGIAELVQMAHRCRVSAAPRPG
jgi:FixJ family two-component response regulator